MWVTFFLGNCGRMQWSSHIKILPENTRHVTRELQTVSVMNAKQIIWYKVITCTHKWWYLTRPSVYLRPRQGLPFCRTRHLVASVNQRNVWLGVSVTWWTIKFFISRVIYLSSTIEKSRMASIPTRSGALIPFCQMPPANWKKKKKKMGTTLNRKGVTLVDNFNFNFQHCFISKCWGVV